MKVAWRIVKEKHAATAFSGDGAAQFGGRWNSRGVRMVYASANKSLAVLESLVHLNPPVAFQYVEFHIEFDETLVNSVALDKLPVEWRQEPPPVSIQALGDAWVNSNGSAILAVPSVIVPSEINYLLNPAHPNFSKIEIAKPEKFVFDARLLK
jgi:RES domain-containing protein